MLRYGLIAVFVAVVASMMAITTWASLERSVLDNSHLLEDRWFLATLLDAYWGFVAIYLWIAYKLSRTSSRIAWFVAVALLGNIAIGVFVLWQLIRWNPESGMVGLLLNSDDIPQRLVPVSSKR